MSEEKSNKLYGQDDHNTQIRETLNTGKRPQEERPMIINISEGGTLQWHTGFEAAADQ